VSWSVYRLDTEKEDNRELVIADLSDWAARYIAEEINQRQKYYGGPRPPQAVYFAEHTNGSAPEADNA
jgi:hypothetical protein